MSASAVRSTRLAKFVWQLLSTDYCPQFNRYVYWLKEPIGWFLAAILASLLIGGFVSPIGWTLAAGLTGVVVVGLAIPWLAVRFATCSMVPTVPQLVEGEVSELALTIRNPLPFPLWGMTIEGFLTAPIQDHLNDVRPPDAGLATVPACSTVTFRLPICPEYRGYYPIEQPKLASAFPFGIWTARRAMAHVEPVKVWPRRTEILGDFQFSGKRPADVGVGNRAGSCGDIIGVRAYRRGDSLRSIHWAQTARQDTLIVCERGGPQQSTVNLLLDATTQEGPADANRKNLACRVRIIASLAELLQHRRCDYQLIINNQLCLTSGHGQSLQRVFDRLTSIPLSGTVDSGSRRCPDSGKKNACQDIRITVRPFQGEDDDTDELFSLAASRYWKCEVSIDMPNHIEGQFRASREDLIFDVRDDLGDRLSKWLWSFI